MKIGEDPTWHSGSRDMCVEGNYRQKIPRALLKTSRRVRGNARQAGCDEALAIEVKIIFPAAVRPDAKGTGWLFRPSLELFAWELPLPRGIVRSYFSACGVHIFVAVGRFSGRPSILFRLQFIAKFNMTSPLGLLSTPDQPELLRQICISYSHNSAPSLYMYRKNFLSIN